MSTRGEKQFLKVFHIHTMLTSTPTFGTSPGVLDLNSSLLVGTCHNGRKLNSMVGNSIVCLHGPTPTSQHHGQTLTSLHHGRNSTKSFSKASYPFWAWRHPYSSHISSLGFIMTMVIVISFARVCKLYPMLCTWTLNLNSSKPNQTEW